MKSLGGHRFLFLQDANQAHYTEALVVVTVAQPLVVGGWRFSHFLSIRDGKGGATFQAM